MPESYQRAERALGLRQELPLSKPKYPRAAALAVAREFCEAFKPRCQPDRLKVCGSLRRRKEHVGDIELIYIPRHREERDPDNFFATHQINEINEYLNGCLRGGRITKRLAITGRISSWGPENKHAVHVESGIPIDFFATTEPDWWVTVVIRTGSKETNLRLTTGARARGLTLNAYGAGFTHLVTGEKIPCTSEREVFEIAGVPYLEPWQR